MAALRLLGFLCLSAIFLECSGALPALIQEEHKLYNDLMENYQKWVRPVIKATDTLKVEWGLTLQNILEVNEQKGYISMNTWWNLMWDDVSLKWNESDYNGIQRLRIPANQVWSPDLAAYNSIGDKRPMAEMHTSLVVVTSDGNISHIPPVIMNTACSFDYTYYPYDEQRCEVKIGSWTHDGNKINLTTSGSGVDMSTFSNSVNGWTVTNLTIPLIRNVITYQCCSEPYIDVTYTITIKRMSTYLTGVMVIPGVILALLVPFIFMFPPDAGEKITLGVGLILGFLLLLLIGDGMNYGRMMPSPPIIFRYYGVNIILVGLSMIISMSVVKLWRDRGRVSGPPKLVSTILVDGLGCILCVNRNSYKRKPRAVSIDAEGAAETDKIGRDDPNVDQEWRLLAMVLDRILFLFFLIISILITIIMLSL